MLKQPQRTFLGLLQRTVWLWSPGASSQPYTMVMTRMTMVATVSIDTDDGVDGRRRCWWPEGRRWWCCWWRRRRWWRQRRWLWDCDFVFEPWMESYRISQHSRRNTWPWRWALSFTRRTLPPNEGTSDEALSKAMWTLFLRGRELQPQLPQLNSLPALQSLPSGFPQSSFAESSSQRWMWGFGDWTLRSMLPPCVLSHLRGAVNVAAGPWSSVRSWSGTCPLSATTVR